MKIKALGVEVKVHNQREKSLVNILNSQLERMIDDWTTKNDWREYFVEKRTSNWRITDAEGLLTAMFYMEMIKEPITALAIFNAVEKEVNEKMDENAA